MEENVHNYSNALTRSWITFQLAIVLDSSNKDKPLQCFAIAEYKEPEIFYTLQIVSLYFNLHRNSIPICIINYRQLRKVIFTMNIQKIFDPVNLSASSGTKDIQPLTFRQ